MAGKKNIELRIKKHKIQLESKLKNTLSKIETPRVLKNVMSYSVLSGGKRIRPFILSEVAKLYNVSPQIYIFPCMAIEMVHCFSLIYDDLPCMDNDDIRRGKPTVHVKFNQANALLGGSSLLVFAYQLLASDKFKVSQNIKNAIIKEFSSAIGAEGMLAGQYLDLEAEDENFKLTLRKLRKIQEMKTSLLIGLCTHTGAILAKASKKDRDLLHKFGVILGRLFQIRDDILDQEGSEKEMGKKIKKDQKSNKATVIRLKNIEYAKGELLRLSKNAKGLLNDFERDTTILYKLIDYLTIRNC